MIIKNSRKKRLGRVYVKSYHGPCVRKMYSTQSGKDGTKRERERKREKANKQNAKHKHRRWVCVCARVCITFEAVFVMSVGVFHGAGGDG